MNKNLAMEMLTVAFSKTASIAEVTRSKYGINYRVASYTITRNGSLN